MSVVTDTTYHERGAIRESLYGRLDGGIFRVMTGVSLHGSPFDGLGVNGTSPVGRKGEWIPAFAGITMAL